MKKDEHKEKVREAVGIFFDADTLERTIGDLKAAGFKTEEIGLLAGKDTVKEQLGHVYQEVDQTGPDAPHMAFVARESVNNTTHAYLGSTYFIGAVAAGGAAVATAGILGGAMMAALASVATAGGVGAIVAKIISKSDADTLEEQVDEGHLLLFVRTMDETAEKKALEILARDAALDPKIYTVE
ncbi:MAG: hypothetical protein WDZ76_04045 [Pseudohongiellaceae bacterium]